MIKRLHNKLLAVGATTAVALSGAFLIIPYEGSVKKGDTHVVYRDAVGIPTACYGQTGYDLYGRKITMGMTYTEEECLEMFVITGNKFEKEMDRIFGDVPYQNSYQKAAFLSFSYNVGTGNLRTSTLVRRFKNGQYEEACDQLSRWVYAQKKKLNGLVTRRADEREWCLATQAVIDKVTYELGDGFGQDINPVPAVPQKQSSEECE